VLIGSVHWIDTWQFDDYENPVQRHQWDVRDVDQAWSDYAARIAELAATNAVDVLAHPDLIKVAGFISSDPSQFWSRRLTPRKRPTSRSKCRRPDGRSRSPSNTPPKVFSTTWSRGT